MNLNGITLFSIKCWPSKAKALADKHVRIWSNEHRAWWRPEGCGYTTNVNEAGIYTFKDAFDCTSDCGPEKGIEYYVCEAEYVI